MRVWWCLCGVLCWGQNQADQLLFGEQTLRKTIARLYLQIDQHPYHPQWSSVFDVAGLTRHPEFNGHLIDQTISDLRVQIHPVEGFNGQILLPVRVPQLAEHLVDLYRWRRPHSEFVAVQLGDAHQNAAFLVVADALDGALDLDFKTTDATGLHRLMVNQQVPLASLCFDRRMEASWRDRRDFVTANPLLRYLPKRELRKLQRCASDLEKLARLDGLIRREVVAVPEGFQEDFWQYPVETWLSRSGDCEDLANLFQSIAEELGVKSRVVIGHISRINRSGQIERSAHAWCEYRGKIFDATVANPADHHYVAELVYDSQICFAVR